ncbi:MAG: hypothetical protein KDC66_20755 [Phaeodactylibacter sp.]|nr:hypothetical protein [Phaeodactylibacter sp.]MCB9273616.1 hypothetical protein [Lewinellaceae bacterium]
MSDTTIRCFSCGAEVPAIEGPVHRYLDSAPGCWARFTEVAAREYSDVNFVRCHQLTVDSYAVQHPGQTSPQAIRSVAVHLASLYMVLERNLPIREATNFIQHLAEHKQAFHWLEPPQYMGDITVVDIWKTENVQAHLQAVRAWAESAWAAWAAHHEQVKAWAALVG